MGARDARFHQPRINSERLLVKVASFISSEEEMKTIFLYAARFYLTIHWRLMRSRVLFLKGSTEKEFLGLRNWT